jgi:tRNA threonylcarbamoyladenosine biosynthesis protein TsaB
MALILNIDTATEKAGICLARDGKALAIVENAMPKDQAAWLHPAIGEMLRKEGCELRDLHAIAVTAGPGSYTGLRVGMAAAKGFCYALGIPLITEDTLKVMALAGRDQLSDPGLLCPMIDARRMEVFTALYDKDLVALMPATAMIVDEDSFSEWLDGQKITFFGSGSDKCKPLLKSHYAAFAEIAYDVGYLGTLSFSRYLQSEFTGLAYSEPAYTKEFYTHTRK